MGKRRDKGEGSIYQRASDNMYVAYCNLADGKRKYIYAKTRGEIVKKLKALQRNIEAGTHVERRPETVQAFFTYWLEIHASQVKATTIATYASHLKPVYAAIGHVKLQALTPDKIQRMYSDLEKKVSSNTVRGVHMALNAAFKDAVRWKFISINPCASVDAPKFKKFYGTVLNGVQARTLIDWSKDTELECFIVLALTLALRRGEITGLKWSDIDLDIKTLTVQRTVSKIVGGYLEGEAKTEHSNRVLLIPEVTLAMLKRHRAKQNAQRLAAPAWTDLNLVYPCESGGYTKTSTLTNRFSAVLIEAGLPHVRIHDLRHSCATLLLSLGVPAIVVSQILGHSSTKITQDVYGHVLPAMQDEAMQKIDMLFGGF